MDTRGQLLKAGVKNLKEFGYPAVDEKNILTDIVYSQFFKGMLEDTIEEVGAGGVVDAAEALLKEIAQG